VAARSHPHTCGIAQRTKASIGNFLLGNINSILYLGMNTRFSTDMGIYSSDPSWADIEPLPTDEGGANPLAAIAYSEEYGEAMSYLRAIMAADESSLRALDLTKHLIGLNPAHYTVWLYRARVLFALQCDLAEELEWLNDIALAHQKNYQIWHHRNQIVDKRDACDGETGFIAHMFDLDAKNYHVWSYRQWLVQRFNLWDEGELEFTEAMLRKDVRNNSAWNHRWFVINGREVDGISGVTDRNIREREVEFTKAALALAPQNRSAWNYLRGIQRHSGIPLQDLRPIAETYADLSGAGNIRSSYALDLLAEILALQKETAPQAHRMLDLLAQTYDPIRVNYWKYRQSLLEDTVPSLTQAAT
jgi:protein farnesyltransferase/geranylgeranyltransferase type-1 subunit alpha